MDKMRAAQLTGLRSVGITEVPKPVLSQDDEVLLRVGAVGICGSDVHYYRHGRIGGQEVAYPFTPGHECTGTVEACGPAAGDLTTGDRVAVDPAVSCGACDQCRFGRPHTCRSLKFLGCPGQLTGCLSEYIVMPARNCFKLPENIGLTQGVLAEPLAIGDYAVDFLVGSGAQTIGILGLGPIGLSVLLCARKTGIRNIFVTDNVEARSKAALDAGAVWAGNPTRTDITADIRERETGLDAVFECCGDPEALDQAVELLHPGGTLLILGIPEVDRVSFDIHRLRRKEIRIQNVRRQNHCTDRALVSLADGSLDASFMITHTFRLQDTGQALETAAAYADGVIKAVISLFHP
jgi:L-iditol 2-dehydrogenase